MPRRRLLTDLLDRLDQRLARGLRQSYGREGWLVSWAIEPDGRWAARLSCPELPHTLVRRGPTRVVAIVRARRALEFWQALWQGL